MIDFRLVDFPDFVCFFVSREDSSAVSSPLLRCIEDLVDFLGLVDLGTVDFLGVGLFLGEVAINASKSPLLSEGTYVLNTRGEEQGELKNHKITKTHDVGTYPSLCLYLAARFSCRLALLSSNVSPLARILTGSMKDTNEERWVLMICAAAMPTPATVVGEGTSGYNT